MCEPGESEIEVLCRELGDAALVESGRTGTPLVSAVLAQVVARLVAAEIRIRALEAKLT